MTITKVGTRNTPFYRCIRNKQTHQPEAQADIGTPYVLAEGDNEMTVYLSKQKFGKKFYWNFTEELSGALVLFGNYSTQNLALADLAEVNFDGLISARRSMLTKYGLVENMEKAVV